MFVVNSNFVARRVQKIYRREAVVIHPPMNVASFAIGWQRQPFYLWSGFAMNSRNWLNRNISPSRSAIRVRSHSFLPSDWSMPRMRATVRLICSLVVTIVLITAPEPTYALNQRHGDEFLVTRFGAKCDGRADDSRAFQAALDAASARCGAGKGYLDSGYQTVLVPDGARCRLNSGLVDARSDCVGISSYAGGTLDFSGLPHGLIALTLKPLIYSQTAPRSSPAQIRAR